MLLFFGFSSTSRAHFIMVFTTPPNLLLISVLIQIQIEQVIQLADVLSQVFSSCWVLFLSPSVARSKTRFTVLVPGLSTITLLTPLSSLFDFDGYWLTWKLHSPLAPLSIVIIATLSILLITMSPINTPSILRLTTTSLANISRIAISNCTPSLLPTNWLISSPRLTHLVVFEILYPNFS